MFPLPPIVSKHLALPHGTAQSVVGATFFAVGALGGALGLYPRFHDHAGLRVVVALSTGVLSAALAHHALRSSTPARAFGVSIFGGAVVGGLNALPAALYLALVTRPFNVVAALLVVSLVGGFVGTLFGALYGLAYAPLLVSLRERLARPSLEANDRAREACGIGLGALAAVLFVVAGLVDPRVHVASWLALACFVGVGAGMFLRARSRRLARRLFLDEAAAGRAPGLRVRAAEEGEDLAAVPEIDGRGAVLELQAAERYRSAPIPIGRVAG